MAVSKLSPNERLVRKRVAARLRQQRCRARKRMATQRRSTDTGVSRESPTTEPPKMAMPCRSTYLPSAPFRSQGSSGYWSESSSIRSSDLERSNSFESTMSTTSMTEDSSSHLYYSSSPSYSYASSPSTQPSCPPLVMEEKPLPNNEEAAVDAMLSLKAGVSSPPSPLIHKPVSRHATAIPYKVWHEYPMQRMSQQDLYVPTGRYVYLRS